MAGCGKSDGGVAVTGTVTTDVQPVKGALVTFYPEGDTPGSGGSGVTGADGRYILVPARGGSGIAPGLYKVTISKPLRPDGSPPLRILLPSSPTPASPCPKSTAIAKPPF